MSQVPRDRHHGVTVGSGCKRKSEAGDFLRLVAHAFEFAADAHEGPREPQVVGHWLLQRHEGQAVLIDAPLVRVDHLFASENELGEAGISSEQRAAAGAGDDTIRLSIGIETVGDIVRDLDRALGSA